MGEHHTDIAQEESHLRTMSRMVNPPPPAPSRSPPTPSLPSRARTHTHKPPPPRLPSSPRHPLFPAIPIIAQQHRQRTSRASKATFLLCPGSSSPPCMHLVKAVHPCKHVHHGVLHFGKSIPPPPPATHSRALGSQEVLAVPTTSVALRVLTCVRVGVHGCTSRRGARRCTQPSRSYCRWRTSRART